MTDVADVRAYWIPTEADLPNVPATADRYWNSVSDPQRGWAVDAIRPLGASSVLELGCQCGPNLRALREAFPTMRLVGLDVNAHALAFGRERLPDVEFVEGAVPEALAAYSTGSIDVVLSTFCLAYQSPARIAFALFEALGVAKVAVVLIEPMREAPTEVRVHGNDYVEWQHNYMDVVEQILNSRQWNDDQHGLQVRYDPHPPHDVLTGALVLEHRYGVPRG